MCRGLGCRMAVAVVAGAYLAAGSARAQQAYPTQAVRIIVAAGAGGFADAVTRVIGDHLGARLGQSIVIENRAGAGGNIGARAVAQSSPDGHTVLVSTTSMAINGTLYKAPGYATSDITPVAIVGASPEVIVVHPSHPARTLAQFLKPADGKPLQFGTAGVGSGSHIAGEYLFKVLAKAPAEHVAFAGGAPAIQNLIGNHLNAVVGTMPAFTEHFRSGALRGIAVMAPRRAEANPDVPTLAEGGYPDFHAASWVGFFAPARTEAAVVTRLNGAINEVLGLAPVIERLRRSGLDIIVNGPADTQRFFQGEIDHWTTRVKALGLSIN